ncbi:MAG: hypothetical protein P4L92_01235 [Rudaea sp.]|nr:hypothetical protein [Rudaea sp.]
MTLQWMRRLTALLALLLVTAAYAGAPHYADLKLSDSEDGDAMESFAPDTAKIFLHAGLVDVASGSKLSSTWIAEDTGGVAPANYKIDSVTLNVGMLTNVATFSLSKPTAGWPVGKYRVDLFIDGKASGTVHFKVEADD